MKRLAASLVGALGLLATQAMAQPITYYVQSEPYESITNSTACPVGVCKAYEPGQRLGGTITFFGPLDPNLNVQTDDVGAMIDDFQLIDGQNTYTLLNSGIPNPNIVINFANVSTDASGVITAFEFKSTRRTAHLSTLRRCHPTICKHVLRRSISHRSIRRFQSTTTPDA